MRGRLFLGVAAVVASGCGSAPPTPTPAPTPAIPVVVVAASTVAPTVAPPPPQAPSTLPMYPVAHVYSLLHLETLDGGLELCLGADVADRQSYMRFVPLVDGEPDIDHLSDQIPRLPVSAFGLYGDPRHILLHEFYQFRSAQGEGYAQLRDDGGWARPPAPLPGAVLGFGTDNGTPPKTIGVGIYPWSKDRLLEWRVPTEVAYMELPFHGGASPDTPLLPELRVIRGADKLAPSVPPKLSKQLLQQGFVLTTYSVLKSGEVIAIGRRPLGGGFDTILWTDDLKAPAYFPSEANRLKDPSDLGLLGGTSLANLRLRVADQVMRLNGNTWEVESTIPPSGLPDVWFGAPDVMMRENGVFARTAKDAPWLPLAVVDPKKDYYSAAVAPDGTIFMTIYSDADSTGTLYASRKPGAEKFITQKTLVEKASIEAGGYRDFNASWDPNEPGCKNYDSKYYVLLDRSPVAKAPTDYPEVRAMLKGHTEFANAEFVVSREGELQFLGAELDDEDTAKRLGTLASKRPKVGAVICAAPTPTSSLKINLRTGNVIP